MPTNETEREIVRELTEQQLAALPEEWQRLWKLNEAATPNWEFRPGNDAQGDSCDLLVAPLHEEDPEFDQEYGQVLFHDGGFSDEQINKNWEFVFESRTAVPRLLRDLAEARLALREAQSGKEGK